jgi:Mor family transcriptional regulator
MKKKNRIMLLAFVILLVGSFAVIRSLKLYNGIKNIKMPNKENRHINNMDVNKWITVKSLSKKFNISEDVIFEKLRITKEKGDENIPLKDLAKKYDIADDDIKKVIKSISGDIRIDEGTKNE